METFEVEDDDVEEQDDENKINNLISQQGVNRNSLHSMINEIDYLKTKVEKLFPEDMDMRNVRVFEERIKTVTGFFSTILDIRKEINRSLKDEIEIRRKLKINDNEESFLKNFSIQDIVAKIKREEKQNERKRES